MADNDDAETKSPTFSTEGLKRDLAVELDKIGHNRKTADEESLRKNLRRWLQNGPDASPRTLLYPVKGDPSKVGYGSKYDPNVKFERTEDGTMDVPAMPPQTTPKKVSQPVGIHTFDERGRAVVKLLRELARDEDFEVFLTQLSGARNPQEQEHTVSGSSCRDYLDVTGRLLFSNFMIPREDVLCSAHTDCEVVRLSVRCAVIGYLLTSLLPQAIAIVPSRHLLDELLGKTGEDDPRIKIMLYLLQPAVQQAQALGICLTDYMERNRPDGGNISGFPWIWPVQIVEACLILWVFFQKGKLFDFIAAFYPEEPPLWLFAQLSSVIDLGGQMQNLQRYADGLDYLLGKVSNENIVDALWQLEHPEDVAENPQGYVAMWIDDYLTEIEGKEYGSLDLQEAKVVVAICAQFQKGFHRDKQWVLPSILQLSNHTDDDI